MWSIGERGISCKTLQKHEELERHEPASHAFHALLWVPGASNSSILKAHRMGALVGQRWGWRWIHGCSLLPYRPSALSHWTSCLEDG